MSEADKYLRELDKLAGKKSARRGGEFRESYERKAAWEKNDIYEWAGNLSGSTLQEYRNMEGRGMSDTDLRALARRTMELAKEDDYVRGAIYAANIYAGLGKSHIGIIKLMAVVRKATKDGKVSERDYEDVRHFIKEHTGKRQEGGGGLEHRLPVFILLLLGGLVLSLTSLTATGNAVSNLTGTTQGLVGIFLFIAGLVGMFFHFKVF